MVEIGNDHTVLYFYTVINTKDCFKRQKKIFWYE
jgi:peroxiredoxin